MGKYWKKIARMLCFMPQSNFRPSYFFINNSYVLDFCAQNYPLIFLNLNPFQHQQVQHFGILNYEKQHKEGLCKVLDRSVVFSAFYADFYLCPKSVIITSLSHVHNVNTNSQLFSLASGQFQFSFLRIQILYGQNRKTVFKLPGCLTR